MFLAIMTIMISVTQFSAFAQTDEILTIRTVFHVVHSSEEQNISEEQIHSQLEILNLDYRKLNPNADQTLSPFENVAGDARIHFILASVDDDGLETSGITRTSTSHGPFGNNDLYQSSFGGIDPWDPQKYLNIWVADLPPGLLGNASPPGSTEFDGVALDFMNVGNLGTAVEPYDRGRTATHEIGHWLGLGHLWGATGDCESDDGLEDTTNMTRTFGNCNTNQSTCGTTDMVQNFMNLEEDACLTFFTLDQINLMRSTLLNLRSGVITENTLVTALISQNSPQNDLRAYPNPSHSGTFQLLLRSDKMVSELVVTDLAGRVILKYSHLADGNYLVDLRGYPRGVYWLSLKTKNQIINQRIIYES